jgi:hypothetical protein
VVRAANNLSGRCTCTCTSLYSECCWEGAWNGMLRHGGSRRAVVSLSRTLPLFPWPPSSLPTLSSPPSNSAALVPVTTVQCALSQTQGPAAGVPKRDGSPKEGRQRPSLACPPPID